MSKFGIWEGDTSGSSISLASAFTNNTNITEITKFDVDGSKITNTYGLFLGCTNLKSVVLPSGLTNIGQNAFNGCTKLSSITIPDTVSSIGPIAFYNCSSLTSITIPDKVSSIGLYTFSGCTSLSSITLGSGLTTIGDTSFYNCRSLQSVTIPNSVTKIENQAFSYCTKLTKIDFGNTRTAVPSMNSSFTDTNNAPIIVPDSLYDSWKSKWGDYASRIIRYSEYYHMLTITRTDGTVEYYDDYTDGEITDVFSGQTDIQSVIIGKGATSMPYYMFDGCTGITSVVISRLSNITTVPQKVFVGCTSLSSITIGNSVTSIEDFAFRDCTSLSSITIPDSVTTIGNWVFENCTSLNSITIGNSVTSIGGYAFVGCRSLSSITIPDSVTTIGNSAFNSCTSLTSITANCPATAINANTFQGVATGGTLTYLSVNDLSSWLSTDAYYLGYYGWTGQEKQVTTITYTSTDGKIITPTTGWSANILSNTYTDGVGKIVFDDVVTALPNNAFKSCSTLLSMSLPSEIVTVGDTAFHSCTSMTALTQNIITWGYAALYNCNALQSLTIAEGTTALPQEFLKSGSLATLVLPSTLTDVSKNYTFQYCSSLSSITCKATTAPSVGSYTFYNVKSSGTLYYPSGSDYSTWLSRLGSGWSGQTFTTEEESSDEITLVEDTYNEYMQQWTEDGMANGYTFYVEDTSQDETTIDYTFNQTNSQDGSVQGYNRLYFDLIDWTGTAEVNWFTEEYQNTTEGEVDEDGNPIDTWMWVVTNQGSYSVTYSYDIDENGDDTWTQNDITGDLPPSEATNQFIAWSSDYLKGEIVDINGTTYDKWTFHRDSGDGGGMSFVTMSGTYYIEET